MKIQELREMSDDQLEATLRDAKDTLFRLRIRAQTERLDAPSEMKRHRRLIARILTLQTQRAPAKSTPAKSEAAKVDVAKKEPGKKDVAKEKAHA